ncbi:MAG: hypothetical protein RBS49_09160 [Sphaerochaeta sp.]|jgi:hypothetical protein|nr:hypothetical protein [Sphaerochaeta sp.]
MLRTLSIITLALVLATGSLFGAFNPVEADALFDTDRFIEARTLLLGELANATTAEEESAILWRLARVMVSIGDDLDKKDKDGRFAAYEEGEAYALRSIALKASPEGYLWKASNIGRWGQTKGPLNALGKAKGMLEDLTVIVNDFGTLDSTETWYVLSALYNELPAVISFGNNDWAISYGRKSLEHIPVHLLYPGHYKKVAEELWARNWSASKRTKEFAKMQKNWDKATTNLERYRYYEGRDGGKNTPFYSSVPLTAMNDRQEAEMLLSYILAKYKVFSPIKRSDTREIGEIEELRNTFR